MAGILANMLAGGAAGGFKAMGEIADDRIKDKREAAKQEVLMARADTLAKIEREFRAGESDKVIKAQADRALLEDTRSHEQFMAKMGQDAAQADTMKDLKEQELKLKKTEIGYTAEANELARGTKGKEKEAKNLLDKYNLLSKQIDSIYNKYPAEKDEMGNTLSKYVVIKKAAEAGDSAALKDFEIIALKTHEADKVYSMYNTLISGGEKSGSKSLKDYKAQLQGERSKESLVPEIKNSFFSGIRGILSPAPLEDKKWNFEATPAVLHEIAMKYKKETISTAEKVTGKKYIPRKRGIILPKRSAYGRSMKLVLKNLSEAGVPYEVEQLDNGKTLIKLMLKRRLK